MSFLSQWSLRGTCSRCQPLIHLSRRNLHASIRRLQEKSDASTKVDAAKATPPEKKPEVDIGEANRNLKVVLAPLARPLGVRERPTTVIKTAKQKLKDLMDNDVRMAQRRHLIKEASKGYFHDLNMTRQHGGKTWIAPKVLIREDKSLYLPNIQGKSMLDKTTKSTTEMCFGKISLIAMLGTQISEIHTRAFSDMTNQRYKANPLFQYIQINLQENMMKAFLVNLFLSKLRSVVPADEHANYLVSKQNMEYVREAMGMTNSKVGYVYLVDENLRIRWAGCADPTAEEIQALESCTGVLLKRLERKAAAPQPKASPASSPA